MGRRRQELKKQADHQILSDVGNYIDNIKYLANDKTDKRVMLNANRYLLDRPIGAVPRGIDDDLNDDNKVNEIVLKECLREFRIKKK